MSRVMSWVREGNHVSHRRQTGRSRWDACPNAVLEAVALGVPTLVTPYPLGRFLARRIDPGVSPRASLAELWIAYLYLSCAVIDGVRPALERHAAGTAGSEARCRRVEC